MENLRNRFMRFMYGRYGTDSLNKGILGLVITLLVINLFLQSLIIDLLVLAAIIYMNYRTFSKNIYKRQLENKQYIKLITPIQKSLNLTLRRIKEIRTSRFRKCPSCGQVLRLKRSVGKHSVTCPKCANKVNVHIVI